MRRFIQEGNYVQLMRNGYISGMRDIRVEKIFQAGGKDGVILMGALLSMNKTMDEIKELKDTLINLLANEQYVVFHDVCQEIMDIAYHSELDRFYMMIEYKSIAFVYELALLTALYIMSDFFYEYQEDGIQAEFDGHSLEEVAYELLEEDLEDEEDD